jgi:ubiquinone/menaquinone biosynthesis C-methylase UbiE
MLGYGCRSSEGSAPPGGVAGGVRAVSGPEGGEQADEASVRPGVNDRYSRPGSYERWANMFSQESREVFEHRHRIVEWLDLKPGSTVADVGAGTGVFTSLLADALLPGGEVLAVEIVPTFLDRLREIAADRPEIRVIEADARHTHLETASVDLAFLCNVYHHIEYPQTYMRDVHRALKPGGRLVVIDFQRVEGVTSRPMMKHVRADRDTVVAELAHAGFELVDEIEGLRENYVLVLKARS